MWTRLPGSNSLQPAEDIRTAGAKDCLTAFEAQAEWYRKQGFKLAFSESSGWVEFARGVFQAFPFHWVIAPSEDEIKNLIERRRLIALRYSTPLTSSSGQISYHVIYDRSSYLFEALPKKARHDVTKGLACAVYEPVALRRLATEGWELRTETLARQGRPNAETQQFWQKMCLAAEGLPGFEAWGAVSRGRLVAALLAITLQDTVGILYQQSRTDFLQYGVNNALTFTFTQTALQRPGVRRIFYGLHSLDAPPGVDHYKFRMGYAAIPVRQRIVYNPIVRPLVNSLSHSLLRQIRRVFPASHTLSKAEGMLRFFLQGGRPLARQDWPEPLAGQRDAILAQIEPAAPAFPAELI